jgi:hypothetical protein
VKRSGGPDPSEPDEERLRALSAFGPLSPRSAAVILLALAFVPAGLGVVGAGVAYDLSASAWSIPLGLLAGLGVGLAFARDLARWRFRPLSLAACVAFLVAFALSQCLRQG